MGVGIQDKTAIVTGAGRGIGLAIARHFVERGANVMFADMDEAALTAAMSDFNEGDPHVRSFSGRMSEKLATANLLSATLDAFDRVDILVNAHRLVKVSDPLDTDLDVLEQLLRQNMMAGLRMTQVVAKRMIKQAEENPDAGSTGAIVNISTLAALHPVPTMLGYSIAYAAQEQATRGMALALAPHRIRVNGVRFGSVMSHELRDSLRDKPELRDRIVAATPMAASRLPTNWLIRCFTWPATHRGSSPARSSLSMADAAWPTGSRCRPPDDQPCSSGKAAWQACTTDAARSPSTALRAARLSRLRCSAAGSIGTRYRSMST